MPFSPIDANWSGFPAEIIEPTKLKTTGEWLRVLRKIKLVYYPRKHNMMGDYNSEEIGDIGGCTFHNVKELLARFFVTIHAKRGKITNWRNFCIGITSQIQRGGETVHLPMFDFDGQHIKTRVKKDIKLLQKKFRLSDATIYETKGGLHVYFFTDAVSKNDYMSMLNTVQVCKGFRSAAKRRGYAVLRLSAKYTTFDIIPYKVMTSPNRGGKREGVKAAIIKELLRQGQECGTHFASMYPQWACYTEDEVPWKPPTRTKKGKLIRKMKKMPVAEPGYVLAETAGAALLEEHLYEL